MTRELRKRAPKQAYTQGEGPGSSDSNQEGPSRGQGIARFTQRGVNNTQKHFEPEPRPKRSSRCCLFSLYSLLSLYYLYYPCNSAAASCLLRAGSRLVAACNRRRGSAEADDSPDEGHVKPRKGRSRQAEVTRQQPARTGRSKASLMEQPESGELDACWPRPSACRPFAGPGNQRPAVGADLHVLQAMTPFCPRPLCS